MWCAGCDQKVDFNSVAVSSPRTAMTLDLEGDVDPTVVTSAKAQVINVCKNCGSQSLYPTKSEADRAKSREVQRLLEEKRMMEAMKVPNLSWGEISTKAGKWTIVLLLIGSILEFSSRDPFYLEVNDLLGLAGGYVFIFIPAFLLCSVHYKGNEE
jgi:hypothetical protein